MGTGPVEVIDDLRQENSDLRERLARSQAEAERARAEGVRLESELHHAQKLEAVGQLAAGIAHEINTPIQYIRDNIGFLREAFDAFAGLVREFQFLSSTEAGQLSWAERVQRQEAALAAADAHYLIEEVPQAAAQAAEGIQRVATIVQAMKAFGHPTNEKKDLADINEAVRTTLIVATNQLKNVAEVGTDLGELPRVLCHIGDINQVLLNLVLNAAHAIAEANGATGGLGKITVRTRSEDGYAVIDVSDTGTGIPAEIRDRIFEPFFTTKDVGAGTGQGLSLAHGLIHKRHGGTITFESAPGVGTTFTVRIPVTKPER
jgi:signal transduction histidine kinase